jgi:hypothetical protein
MLLGEGWEDRKRRFSTNVSKNEPKSLCISHKPHLFGLCCIVHRCGIDGSELCSWRMIEPSLNVARFYRMSLNLTSYLSHDVYSSVWNHTKIFQFPYIVFVPWLQDRNSGKILNWVKMLYSVWKRNWLFVKTRISFNLHKLYALEREG